MPEAADHRPRAATRTCAFLAFCFPPHAGPESRHNLSTVRAFIEHGYAPTVICAPPDIEYPKDDSLGTLVPPQLRVGHFEWPRRSDTPVRRVRRLLRIPANPLQFGGAERIYRAAATMLEGQRADFIYSIHGIGAVHLAARRLKRQTGLPWVAEFRDPLIHNRIIWAYVHDHSWEWWERRERRHTCSHQGRILDDADLIVVESPAHARLLTADFGLPEGKVVPLGMGYGEEYFADLEEPLAGFPRRPVIGFIGSLYYGYDKVVRDFLAALRDLENEGRTFTLVPVGGSAAEFSAWARAIGLRSIMPIERVSFFQALALMRSMDFGMVCVGPDYAANINSKVWEYLRFDLSILALVPNPGAMAELVNRGHCGYVLPYDVREMRRVLDGALADFANGRIPHADPEFIAQSSRRRLITQLVGRIEQILQPRST